MGPPVPIDADISPPRPPTDAVPPPPTAAATATAAPPSHARRPHRTNGGGGGDDDDAPRRSSRKQQKEAGTTTDDDDGDGNLQDQLSFRRTVAAFAAYERSAGDVMRKRREDFRNLSPEHKRLLGFDTDQFIFAQHEQCIKANQLFLSEIASVAPNLFHGYWPNSEQDIATAEDLLRPDLPSQKEKEADGNGGSSNGGNGGRKQKAEEKKKKKDAGKPTTSGGRGYLPATPEDLVPSHMDIDKVHSTLRQFVRDWTDEGRGERESVYAPIRAALGNLFPEPRKRANVRVLVPGAGLSRLSFEVALMGFASQGNEFSYHMLLAGHWILNHVEKSKAFKIHPFCDSTINTFSRADQFRALPVPDISTAEALEALESQVGLWGDNQPPEFGEFSMIAGEFVEVYSKPHQIGAWNAIVTCFFVDTAKNIIEYVEVMRNALAEGGYWINCGPLLYHYSDQLGEQSIDLTYDEVRSVIARAGFAILNENIVHTRYATNGRSMKQQQFTCPFFLAKKVSAGGSNGAAQATGGSADEGIEAAAGPNEEKKA